MGPSPRNLVIAAAAVVVLGGLAWTAFREEPVPVDLVPVDRGLIRVTVDADGKTRIREIYEVAAPVAGTARRAPVEVGDPVRAGQTVVATVEPVAPSLLDARARSQLEAAVQEAEAAVSVAESELLRAAEQLEFAQSQFDRAKTLVDRGVASITQLEDASQRLEIARATRAAAQARLDMSKGALERARAALLEPEQAAAKGECCVEILAPIDGVVLSIPVVSARPVQAGTVLLSVGDPDDLEIVADLLSTDAVRLSPGAPASVERWGGDGLLAARLERIEPAARTRISALGIEEQRVDATLSFLTPPEDRRGLGHGFSVFVRIVEWQNEDALRVPLGAIYRREDEWFVLVRDGNRAAERRVELGRRDERSAEVISGLQEGDEVIVHPADRIADGTLVEPRTGR